MSVGGPQYWNQDSIIQGDTHRFVDTFDHFPVTQDNQARLVKGRAPTSGTIHNQWDDEPVKTKFDSHDMSRFPSQDSTRTQGTQSNRNTHSAVNTFEQNQSGMYPVPSQGSFHFSSAKSDVTARSTSPEASALCATTQLEIPTFDYNFLGDDLSSAQPMFQRNSTTTGDEELMNLSMPGQSFSTYATAGDDSFAASYPLPLSNHAVVTEPLMYAAQFATPPLQWDGSAPVEFLESHRSSPTAEDAWSQSQHSNSPITNSPQELTHSPITNSPQEYYSPTIEATSPRYVEDFQDLVEHPPYASGDRTTRKPMGPRQSKVVSDRATHGRQQRAFDLSEDSSKFPDNTARDHPLYHNVTTHADGFYHCPWEGQAACQHKPEKLKCNYEYEFLSFPF